jgi:hypothetical protein
MCPLVTRAEPEVFAVATLERAIEHGWRLELWRTHVEAILAAQRRRASASALFIVVPSGVEFAETARFIAASKEVGVTGVIVEGRVRDSAGGWLVGRAALAQSRELTRKLRQDFGPELPIIAGGAIEPADALALLDAGANAVQIDAALVYSGPGIAKRMNEAILWRRLTAKPAVESVLPPRDQSPPAAPLHAAAMSWFWAFTLGIAMLLGGSLALAIAATRVTLPYDEAFLQMSRDELNRINPHLLDFMSHDRVTLAGTMLADAIIYLCLAWFAIRRGRHWAKVTVLASALAGFASFFLFLGFGYFDPFHAFVTAILFQFVLLAFQGRLAPAEPPAVPDLHDDWRWRLAQWGTLLLLVEAAALVAAGVTISVVGSTSVFVREDLEFMRTTAEALAAANPRLVPVVAHDRASFGGMLISCGLATLLVALWGIRRGESWLGWMLLAAGTVAYGATLYVHLHVGYTDPLHLAPALGGLALLYAALGLLWPFLGPQVVTWPRANAV